MKKQLSSFLLLLSFVFSVSAQKAQVAKPSGLERALRKHIEYLASDKLEGRRTGEPGATVAAGYVANIFANLHLKPGVVAKNGKTGYLQPFSFVPSAALSQPPAAGATPPEKKPVEAYNVIGILPGNDPVLKNEAIVIGAHYDHLGHGGQGSLVPNSTEIHHGADDNASGVAAIIELARQFAKEKNNNRTIIFIAFSGEEEGLFGSNYYVNNPVFPLDKTVAMINLDMVGRLNDLKLTIGGMGTANEWKALVEAKNIIDDMKKMEIVSILSGANGTGQKTIYPVEAKRFQLQLNEDGLGPSDHQSFYLKKIPVLFFFTGSHNDYHKPTDTADKINYEGEVSVVNYVAAIAKGIDQNAVRPTYTVAKSSGTPGGRSGFNISLGTIPNYADSSDGLLLDGVRDNSPAANAGVKAGDKVVKLAGKDVNNVQDYTNILGTMKADVEYEIVVLRATERLTLKITPIKRQ